MSNNLVRHTWVPLVISLVIFYLCCLIPAKDIPEVRFDLFIPADKLVHFIMYFGLSGATAFYYLYDKRGNIYMGKLFILAILFPILYGGLIELLQDKYFPPRTGDWFDFLADVLGTLATIPLIFYYRSYLLKKYISI